MRNKIILLTAIVFSMVAGAAAQTAADVDVSDPKFNMNIYGRYNIGLPANPPQGSRAGLSFDPLQEISASFRNSGTKTIKKISWEFITQKQAEPTEIEYVYTVNSNQEIAPGETVRLSKTGAFWTRGISPKARVVRVEYADGTVWKGTKTKN
jgi:hypothetical protein